MSELLATRIGEHLAIWLQDKGLKAPDATELGHAAIRATSQAMDDISKEQQ